MSNVSVDARAPAEIPARISAVCTAKTRMPPARTFALAVAAGMFIAFGAVFATTVSAGAGALPFGVAKLLGGLVFCLGLILVVGAGAELFTGNTLIVVSVLEGRASVGALLGNWGVVYAGNFLGSVLIAAMVYLGREYTFGGGAVGVTALSIAEHKVHLDFLQAVVLGTLCNTLVCLAIWLCAGARTMAGKILAIIFPITAFVAAGFEHSIANMYFIPMGLLLKGNSSFLARCGKTAADYSGLTWGSFITVNLVPVTIGNIIGGVAFVGALYWFAYLKPAAGVPPPDRGGG